MEDKIKKLQLECDELFKVDGLTDEVLDLQLKINKLKHEHDIVLEEDKLFEDFVQ
jgi:FtsZ-binding cell division protein ZapB